MKKIILDLCGGTGSWSKPYSDAGYDVRVVTMPGYDVQNVTFWQGTVFLKDDENGIPVKNIYGILAAPPCTMFSLARTTAKTPRDLGAGMSVVQACLGIIWEARIHNKLAFWVIENPKGLLRQFLGKPAFEFDASEFGEDYNKGTDLWGYFKEPKKKHSYTRYSSTDKNTRKLPALPIDYIKDPNMTLVAMKRSITPQGFAKAFMEANP